MTEQTFVGQVDDLARLMGLDVAELHELHKAVSRRVSRIRIPELDRPVVPGKEQIVQSLPQLKTTSPPVGLDARTGKHITGWPYVEHYIETVLTTRIGSRVMRRHLGTQVPEAQDAPGSEAIILQVFRSVAEAMDKYVPWYRLSDISLADAGRDGAYLFLLSGTYYPNAHKGDFSASEERLARIVLSGRGGIA